jgi:hypothetical protein
MKWCEDWCDEVTDVQKYSRQVVRLGGEVLKAKSMWFVLDADEIPFTSRAGSDGTRQPNTKIALAE